MSHGPYRISDDGGLILQFHPGQWQAWDSMCRIILILAGTQGGKTSFGPLWMMREIQEKGAGDYIVAAPTFPLLQLKTIPEYIRLFETILQVATYTGSPVRKLTFTAEGQERLLGSSGDVNIYFGHAQDPDSLESMTAKAAHLDECGQKKFKLGSYEAIMRRLSIYMGRVLMTTTPYNLGWLKQKVYDVWRAGSELIDVIHFRSIDNPAFPQEEYERARRDLPRWKFDMFYNARFTRPAGLIYDIFNEALHKIPRFQIPDAWPRYLGLDFGGVNTAGVFLASEPGTKNLYAYRQYHAGGRTAKEHVQHLTQDEAKRPRAVGGAKSEQQWRDEFAAGGLAVSEPPISDVEVGIDRVYGTLANHELFIFDDLDELLDEMMSYSRVLDESGEPTEKIEDKNSYHLLDALRYVVSLLRKKQGGISVLAQGKTKVRIR